MWPKFGKFSISFKEVIITSFLQGFEQKNHNLGLTLGNALEILH